MAELNYADESTIRSRMKRFRRDEIDSWDVDDFYRLFKESQYNAGECLTEKQALELVLGAAQMQKSRRVLALENIS